MRLYLKSVGLLTIMLLSINLPPLPNSNFRLVAVAQTVPDRKAEADRLLEQGKKLIDGNQSQESLQPLQQALKIYQEIKDRSGQGQTLKQTGNAYSDLKDYEKTIAFQQQALAIAREIKDRDLEARALNNIGGAYRDLKKIDQAIAFYEQSLAVSRSSQNFRMIIVTSRNLAIVYGELKSYDKAIALLEEGIIAAQKSPDRSEEARFLNEIGNNFYDAGNYIQAIAAYQKGLLIAKDINNKKLIGTVLTALGAFYQIQGKSDRAITLYQQALPIAQATEDPSLEAIVLQGIGIVYNIQENFDQALKFYQQALKIRRELEDRPAQLETLNLMSKAYALKASNSVVKGLSAQAKGESSRGLEVGQEALTLARALHDPKTEASILVDMGSAYSVRGEAQKAIVYLEQAASIAQAASYVSTERSAVAQLVSIYSNQGNYQKATELGRRQVEIDKKRPGLNGQTSQAVSLINLGSIYALLQEYQKAIDVYQQALAILEKPNISQLPPILQDSSLGWQNRALEGLTLSYNELGELETALKYAQQNLSLAQKIGQPKLKVGALLRLAFVYTGVPDFTKAMELTQQALAIAQQSKDPQLEAQSLSALSDLYNKQGKHASALESVNQILAIAQRIGNDDLKRDAFSKLTDIYSSQGNNQKALEVSLQKLALVRQNQQGNYESSALADVSRRYTALGDIEKAIQFAKEASKLGQQRHSSRDEQFALLVLGGAYVVQGEYDQATQVGQSSLALAIESKNFIAELSARGLLTDVYNSLGNYQNVIAVGEPGLARAQKLRNRPQEANFLISVGNAYVAIGNPTKGKELIEQGLKIARELKNPGLETVALARLGNAYVNSVNYQKGFELYQQSLKLAQTLDSPPAQTLPLQLLGSAYADLGDYQTSNQYYQRELPILRQSNNRYDESIVLTSIAANNFSQGNPKSAIESANQALAIAQQLKKPSLEAWATRILSVSYGELRDQPKAIAAAQAYLTFTRKAQNTGWEKDALNLLAGLQARFGKKQEAIALYQQALAVKAPIGVGNSWGIYAGLARTTAAQQPNTAIVFYKQAINGIQDVRRNIEGLPPQLQQSFLQATVDFDGVKTSDIYRQLANLLLSQGRILEVQQTLELLKVQELKDFDRTTRAKIDGTKVELDPAERTIIEKYGSFVAFGQKLRECQASEPKCAELDRLLKLRSDADAEYAQAVKSFEVAIKARKQEDENGSLDPESDLSREAQKIVKEPNTALIYSFVTDDKLWLVLASKGETLRQFEVKVSQADLNSAVVKFRQLMEQCEKRLCSSKDTTALNAVSQQLYGWLFPKPLQQELQGKIKHLVFAQDRITRYIPMAALYDGKQYLLENYTVSTIVSAKFTNTDKPTYGATTSVLAAGLSNAAPPEFPPLSNVPLELAAIVQNKSTQSGIFPGLTLLNQQFDFSSLQKNLFGHTILHIATHGAFVRNQADASYILLGTGQKMPIPEIKKLKDLGEIQLVVLSACQTALADRGSDGIEISNVSFSFLNGGVKAVIASLWQVNDASTSFLMQQFYRNLATGKMTKSEALRQAQLSLLQGKVTANDAPSRATIVIVGKPQSGRTANGGGAADLSHPYYWAPFILIGNGL